MPHPDLPLTVDAARTRVPALVEDVRSLVEVESPSDDHTALARSAEAVVALCRRVLGLEPEVLLEGSVPHLRLRLGHGSRRVVLVAHHDTVWPLGTLQRLPFSETDGVLRGPGCFDMKTGVVMAVHALAVARELDPTLLDGVTLLVTGDEELGSPTSRPLIEDEARGAHAALVLEAAGDDGVLKVGRKGVSVYDVLVHGRASHAGLEPERGANAAVEAAHQVLALASLGALELGTTVTPTVVQAGTARNTVAAEASILVDVRARTTSEQERVHEAITSLTAQVDGCTVEVRGGINRPPLEPAMAEELFGRAASLAEELRLEPLRSASVGGASDGNFTAGVGVPTLDGLGAVGGGAHAEHEHVLVEAIPGRLALLTALLVDLQRHP